MDPNPRTMGVLLLAVLLAVLLVAAPASAHGDGPAATDGDLALDAGAHEAFTLRVHWHRVVGTVRATGPADAPAEVLVLDDAAWTAFLHGEPFEATVRAGPAAELRLNALVRCCDDATWTVYHLVVRNADPDRAATFDVDLATVHDDAGVGMTAAESGGVPVFSTLTFGGAALVLGRRVWPRIRAAPPGAAGTGRSGPWSDPAVRAAVVAAGLLVLLVGLSVAGMALFGGGPIEGGVAALTLFPFPTNEVISRTIPIFGGALVGTIYVLHAWTRAIQRDRGDASPRLLALGGLAAAAMLTVLVLGVATYGPAAIVGGVVMTVPLSAVALVGILAVRRERRERGGRTGRQAAGPA